MIFNFKTVNDFCIWAQGNLFGYKNLVVTNVPTLGNQENKMVANKSWYTVLFSIEYFFKINKYIYWIA